MLFDVARKPRGVCILGKRGKRLYQVQRGEALQSRGLDGREITAFEVLGEVYAIWYSDGEGERWS